MKSIQEQLSKATEGNQGHKIDEANSQSAGEIEGESNSRKENSTSKETLPTNITAGSSAAQQKNINGNELPSGVHAERTSMTAVNQDQTRKEGTASVTDIPPSTQVVETGGTEGPRRLSGQSLNTENTVHSEVEVQSNLEGVKKTPNAQVSKQEAIVKDSSTEMPTSKAFSSADSNKSLEKTKVNRFSISKVGNGTTQANRSAQVSRTEADSQKQETLKSAPEHVTPIESATVKTEIHRDGQGSPEIHATVSCEKDQIKLVQAESKSNHTTDLNSGNAALSDSKEGEESGRSVSLPNKPSESASSMTSDVSAASPADLNGKESAVKGRFKVKPTLVNGHKPAVTTDSKGVTSVDSKAAVISEYNKAVTTDSKVANLGDSKLAVGSDQGTPAVCDHGAVPIRDSKMNIAYESKTVGAVDQNTATTAITAVDPKGTGEGNKKIADSQPPVSQVNPRESTQKARAPPQVVPIFETGKQAATGMTSSEDKPIERVVDQHQESLLTEKSELASKLSTSGKSQMTERSQSGAKTHPIFRLGSSDDADEVNIYQKNQAESPRKCLSPTGEYPKHGPVDLPDPARPVPHSDPTCFPYTSDAYSDKSVPPDLISDTSSTTSSCLESPAITPNLTPSSSFENLLHFDALKLSRPLQNQHGEKVHYERSLSLNSVSI